MNNTTSLKKGTIVGFISAVLSIVIVLPAWWFSSGRDMHTLHDGLSTQFRASVMQILSADGYQAKNALYDQSKTVTNRDNLIKYGERAPGKLREGELENYIRWQWQIESENELFDKIMELSNDPAMAYPSNHQLLSKAKANLTQRIENMKAAHSMMEVCRDAVVNMLRDTSITRDSRCIATSPATE
jgi:hypothetical protein